MINIAIPNDYQNYKLTCKTVIESGFSSFLWAYCKTENMPEQLEQAFTRKKIKFSDLAAYVRQHITNDFSAWYRQYENSDTLNEVVGNMINQNGNRTTIYTAPAAKKQAISNTFLFSGCNLEYVLVPIAK